MLLTSLNYALSLGFVVTFLLAGLVAAALLHTFRNLAGIELRPLAAGETFAGGAHRRSRFGVAAASARATRSSCAPRGAAPVVVDIAGRRSRRCARARRAAARPPRARPRDAVVRVSARAVARLGVRALPARRHRRIPTPETAPPPLPRGAHGQDMTRAGPAATTPTSPDCASTSPAIRCSASRGRPSRAAPAGTRRSSTAPAAAARSRSTGRRCRAALDAETRLARLTAWVLAAERAARPFALRSPAARCRADRDATIAAPR